MTCAVSLSRSPTMLVPTQMYMPASLFLVLEIISFPPRIYMGMGQVRLHCPVCALHSGSFRTVIKANGSVTHGDPVILVVYSHFVLLPVDGGFRVASGRNALKDRRLSCCHHHVCGVLSEVIAQHWRRKGKEMVEKVLVFVA